MKSRFSAILFLTFIAFNGAQGIDLMPRDVVVDPGGPPVKRHFFQDGDKRMSFKIDNNMTVSGLDGAAVFRFDDLKSAKMQLLHSGEKPSVAFGEKSLESYRAKARAMISAEAQQVQLDEEKSNPIAINDWTSYQFVFTYTLFGEQYRSNITFLNYNSNEQLIMDVFAPAIEFDRIYIRSYLVLNSLSEMRTATFGPT